MNDNRIYTEESNISLLWSTIPWGIVGAGASPRTADHVVPGSGTGELAGLSGTMEIHVDADGKHTLALDYQID